MVFTEDRSAAVHYLENISEHPSSHRLKQCFSKLANKPSLSEVPGLLPETSFETIPVDFVGMGRALENGFNLCLHGFGSKLELVRRLIEEYVGMKTVIFRAYKPGASIPGLLEALNEAIGSPLESNCRGAPLAYAQSLIEHFCEGEPMLLTILQLDATPLRSESALDTLSLLARCPLLRLLCTVEHINAPNLWSPSFLAITSFIFQDCTTLSRYTQEELASLLDASGKGGQAAGRANVASCKAVLKVLPASAQKAYQILAEHQLALLAQQNISQGANDDDPEFEDDDDEEEEQEESKARLGLSYYDWYNRCQQNLVISSEPAFRTQLAEFTDHSLVVGVEAPSTAGLTYYLPFDKRQLQDIIQALK